MENLEEFVNKLIVEKGFGDKDPDVLEQIKLDLIDRIEDRINAMIMEKLPEDALDEFESKLDSENQEEIQKFIIKYIPDVKDRVAFELISFKNMYLN
ncbi:MAG: DUF5663 domain-containing protein [bacterium]